jgi:hypothetical protein
MKLLPCGALCLGLLGMTLGVAAAEPTVAPKTESRQVTVAEEGSLAYNAPGEWVYSAPKLPNGKFPPTFKLSPKDQSASLLVTVFWDGFGNRATPMTDAELQNVLKVSSERQYVPTSVEKKLEILKFTQPGVHGWYAQFTDASLVGKNPPPGDFKVVTSGIFRAGNLWGNFTLLTNAKDDAGFKTGLKVIESFKKLEKPL